VSRGSVKPSAQPTLVRIQHPPPPAQTARDLRLSRSRAVWSVGVGCPMVSRGLPLAVGFHGRRPDGGPSGRGAVGAAVGQRRVVWQVGLGRDVGPVSARWSGRRIPDGDVAGCRAAGAGCGGLAGVGRGPRCPGRRCLAHDQPTHRSANCRQLDRRRAAHQRSPLTRSGTRSRHAPTPHGPIPASQQPQDRTGHRRANPEMRTHISVSRSCQALGRCLVRRLVPA